MTENLKIRFRLPNGEEFEAEGPQEFIDSQRTYFLNLVGRTQLAEEQSQRPMQPAEAHPLRAELSRTPAALRTASVPEQAAFPPFKTTSPVDKKRLWEQLLKREGELLLLRRKSRISVREAAMLILAGAKHLLGIDSYRAILLSKSLQSSGFEIVRLDRLLADDIKESYIAAQGSKRSRSYQLTPAGFARAFVLAEKRVGETL